MLQTKQLQNTLVLAGEKRVKFQSGWFKSTSSSAMTKDYITEYSYGLAESFNLIAPRLLVGQTMSHWVRQ
jgi:hypothetical protein